MRVISRAHIDLIEIKAEDFIHQYTNELIKLYAIKGDINDVTYNEETHSFEILTTYDIPKDDIK